MVEVPEALAGGDGVEGGFGKGHVLRRAGKVVDAETLRQLLGLGHLFVRDVLADPVGTVPAEVPREHAGARAEVQHGLPGKAHASVHDYLVELGRVDAAPAGVVRRGTAPVERRAPVYATVDDVYGLSLRSVPRAASGSDAREKGPAATRAPGLSRSLLLR